MKYNNGKDITPEDITYSSTKDEWIATLGFIKIEDESKKQYYARGETKKEAKNNLINIMTEHLQKIK